MLYQREGFPEEDEFVLCTVTKIQHHSIFCHLDEYDRSGMIHISEIAPGRIRNIRDYVQEGKKVICKVLDLDKEKGHIDLSLRRVTEAQKKAKQKVIKQEQKAEKIIEILAERNDVSVKQLYNEVSKKLFDHYEMLFLAFQDVVENDVDLRDYGVSDDIAPPLHELIREKIKPQRVTIGGTLTLTTYASDGVQVIKDALDDATEYEGTEVQYSGAGQYKVTVTAPDYKEAEAILDKSVKAATTVVEENKGAAAFERT